MKSTGIIRKLDPLGRITIPKEVRNKLEIGEKDPIEIFLNGHSIILKRYYPNCILCSKDNNLIEFKEELVCKECVEKLKRL